ncbi:MAG: 3-dehydroquinate dehydratase [Hydrogenophaga sp.]|uniref:3-dehydroquinate dehydratase n=1 Tax=Hydrogenophaga crocea TaxID=2716225 RepID=A0A6G8IM45_9BURK|nr:MULTISPECIES: type II 3-dehydroquinate dehydratase [Hydrogenophaga]MBL0946344.1 3-dehydroquinate dehydratase [Hydrogenophaga sp.]QIM54282.1 3-dehydroquinate dehydratase [Hydrogenophaga crocea]
MKPSVHILNGPNLNLLGIREPHLYGHTTLAQVEQRCTALAAELGLGCVFRQSNHEGVLVDWVQEARAAGAAVVINPAGLSFRSIPLLDALKTLDLPVVEVHITNLHRREPMYQQSVTAIGATGVICGLGPIGYELALHAIAQRLREAAPAA